MVGPTRCPTFFCGGESEGSETPWDLWDGGEALCHELLLVLALLLALLLSAHCLVGSNWEVAGRGGLAAPASGGSWDHPGSITLVLSAQVPR